MPIVRFVTEQLEVDVDPGMSFIDLCDAAEADVTFGCRSGTCGTCRVKVIEGSENLSPMGRDERDFLEGFHAKPNERLGCQLTIQGDCSIQYVGLDDIDA